MTEIKSHEFDRLIASSSSLARVLVIFGPDQGLVSERAAKAAKRSGVPLDDPFAVTQLSVSEIQADPGRLADEVNSIGLFGGEKLVWVKGAANEKQLVDSLAHLDETPPESSFVIIEAGDLKKNASLRKVAAASRNMTAVPCYADDARALNGLIDEILQRHDLKISQPARTYLLEQLGGDRLASRNEIEKLALYCHNESVIEHHHVSEIIGDASSISLDDAVNAIFSGNKPGFLHASKKITSSKTPIFLLLQAVLRQFQTIDMLKAEMEDSKTPPAAVLARHARGMHFRRKPVIERALSLWAREDIKREMNRLQSAILQSRQNAAIEESVALHLLLSITLQSRRNGNSR